LQGVKGMPGGGGLCAQCGINPIKCVMAIYFRLAGAEKVQVRAVQGEQGGHQFRGGVETDVESLH